MSLEGKYVTFEMNGQEYQGFVISESDDKLEIMWGEYFQLKKTISLHDLKKEIEEYKYA